MNDEELKEFCEEHVDRFKNLLELQRMLQYETVEAKFTERELKGLIFALDTLLMLEEQEHE